PPWYSNTVVRHITFGIIIGFTLSVTSTSISSYWRCRRRQSLSQEQHESQPIHLRSNEVVYGVTGLIGNTPLMRINSLSDALGVGILGKAEDRVVLRIIEDAERQAIIMPDDVAQEKVNALQALGADVKRVRPASIYVNIARQAAIEFGRSDIVKGLEDAHENHELHTGSASLVVTSTSTHVNAEGTSDDPLNEDLLKKPRGFFVEGACPDKFMNCSNFEAHYDGTGPEIWRQTNSHVDAFVSGAGTGGTIAGIGRFLKLMDEEVQVVLADPEGSGIYNKVKHGVLCDSGNRHYSKVSAWYPGRQNTP
ncbi:tryptophan synthase beta subunit-like PLP-dependent enzyme, partial [Suillus bovinus]|uniref:tryptophan synthase beta subunit-like PLP-dependent enzyme n=1 Tax=Suillus bovinus TaxID=48563 RepID=UPI001B8829C9